jgi:hypothetical protein
VQHRQVGKLKHKYKGTDREWETLLSHFLLQKQPEGGDASIWENVRMIYTLQNDELTISFRQDVKGIKVCTVPPSPKRANVAGHSGRDCTPEGRGI